VALPLLVVVPMTAVDGSRGVLRFDTSLIRRKSFSTDICLSPLPPPLSPSDDAQVCICLDHARGKRGGEGEYPQSVPV